MEDPTSRRAADLLVSPLITGGPLPLQDLCELLGERAAEPTLKPGALLISHLSAIESAGRGALVFATDARAYGRAVKSTASAILAGSSWREDVTVDPRAVWVGDPRLQFARVAHALGLREGAPAEIHPRATVAPGAQLGSGCSVGANAVIEQGVVMGRNCRIGHNVTVHAGTTLGDRVVVQAGAVLGSIGFGYVRDPASGSYLLFPQQGSLVIEDDVEIGANVTIDRGALEETRIGAGTKIDNLVHIAHNCRVGRDVVIAAQTGISGSCTVEDGAVIGGQVGIGDHVTIGAGVILGSGSGVLPGKRMEGRGEVFWGIPAQPLRAYLKDLARFRRGRS